MSKFLQIVLTIILCTSIFTIIVFLNTTVVERYDVIKEFYKPYITVNPISTDQPKVIYKEVVHNKCTPPKNSIELTDHSIRVINDGDKITGHNIKYIIPSDMKKVVVRLLEPNGTFKREYTLSYYISLKPKEQFQIIVK